MNKCLLMILLFAVLPNLAFSQDKKIDQLEVLYSQKYFTKVLRKANKLLAIPDYDYSGMPTFYKSLATFKLLSDEEWARKNKKALTDAILLYDRFLEHSKVDAYSKSHYFEIVELKQYLLGLTKTYRAKKNDINAKALQSFVDTRMTSVTPYGIDIDVPQNTSAQKSKLKEVKTEKNIPSPGKSKNDIDLVVRDELVTYAKQFIGTPYSWAGTSPSGFDCSGYVGYVFKNFGISVPRSAAAQKEQSTKLNEKEAQKGDLVFFKSGNKITHVGIIISEQGEPLKMVHSSSSKGIITTDIKSSTYWGKKYAGVGRVIK